MVRLHTAHCLEGALAAAVILEQHGYPPRVLSFESIDQLDHVIYVYQRHGLWGSIARSRDPGLHGRKPVFRTARALALSYVDPYVDFTGAVKAYAVVDLRDLMGRYDWRFSPQQPLEGGTGADRLSAPPDPLLARPDRAPAREVPRLLRTPRQEAALLQRTRALDAAAEGRLVGGYDARCWRRAGSRRRDAGPGGAVMARLQSELTVDCPCCGSTLVIDLNLKRVVEHREPERSDKPSLDHAQRILAEEQARREALVRAVEGTRAHRAATRSPSASRKRCARPATSPITKPKRD